jgi:hypothetical protein
MGADWVFQVLGRDVVPAVVPAFALDEAQGSELVRAFVQDEAQEWELVPAFALDVAQESELVRAFVQVGARATGLALGFARDGARATGLAPAFVRGAAQALEQVPALVLAWAAVREHDGWLPAFCPYPCLDLARHEEQAYWRPVGPVRLSLQPTGCPCENQAEAYVFSFQVLSYPAQGTYAVLHTMRILDRCLRVSTRFPCPLASINSCQNAFS